MWTLILTGAKRFGGWILAAFSFLGMIVTVWLTSKKVGKAQAEVAAANDSARDKDAIATRQVNEARESASRQVETVKVANNVQNDNAALSDSDAIDKLRRDWSRD